MTKWQPKHNAASYTFYCMFGLDILGERDNTALNDNSPVLGPGGLWTTSIRANAYGLATAVPFGRVISLPSADDPYLGIEYHVAR